MLPHTAIIIIILLHLFPNPGDALPSAANPGCKSQCGNLTVPYPFGLTPDCSLSPTFHIYCNTSFSPPKPFLPTGTGYEVIHISDQHLTIKNSAAPMCFNASSTTNITEGTGIGFGINSPYTFSNSSQFTLIGCGYAGFIIANGSSRTKFANGCFSFCFKGDEFVDGDCQGVGCCQIPIPKGLKVFVPLLATLNRTLTTNLQDINNHNPCGYLFLRDANSFQLRTNNILNHSFTNRTIEDVPILLDWVIGNETCTAARNLAGFACQDNSYCVESGTDLGGYRCNCSAGYQGNPYLSPGCTDIDECEKNPCGKHATCENTPGNRTCTCDKGYTRRDNSCISEFPVTKFSIGFSVGMFSLLIGITWLYFFLKRRRLSRMREDLFLQNGGLLLKQQMFADEGGVESTKIFSSKELEKATDNYAEHRILGKGGYGTVYKGILPDQHVIAVKKSKIMDQDQIELFINEVIILTRVNHRNVVKLLGCCLECEVPLLVYEFISNGTLFEHIHSNHESSWLPWKDRLRIAAESAGALSYLHSAASMPIIHRDIKSTNILLDDSYTAKIADFGASRLVPLDQTRVTTLVQGTLGYLDPEYFHTSQLTEKSDVYSFGVVLAELVTGMRPLSPTRPEEERNLATHFITSVEENRLFQIVEPRILKEGSMEQVEAIGKLVMRCLSIRGSERPTMKEVAMEVEGVRRLTMHPWNRQQHWEEKEALLGEHSGTPSDLYAVSVEMESSTGTYCVRDGLDSDFTHPYPR